MTGQSVMRVSPQVAAVLPPWSRTVTWLRDPARPRAVDVLRAARRPFVQPRCGVGGHDRMLALLRALDAAGPGLLTITIDSHTRLGHFDTAARVLRERPDDLNGYPLVAHGWRRGRELAAAVSVPVQIRHGSPDARDLFAVSLAAGITSFEGGGIGYNLPYCKDVPLRDSLTSWQDVDALCGHLAEEGVIIDRELFGSLTGVLMPPSISLAVTMLEAHLAARVGVRCVCIAYPQSGEIYQDVAALRAVAPLAKRYLPAELEVYSALHEYMGVFPHHRDCADAVILLGGLTARLGGATKIINKTNQEALGIPTAQANAHGIRTARLGTTAQLDFVELDQARVQEECAWIQREVAELIDPVLQAADPISAIVTAFASGRLDVPFSSSMHARSAVIPGRDADGAVRYRHFGALPVSTEVRRHNDRRLRQRPDHLTAHLVQTLTADINYFKCDDTCGRDSGRGPVEVIAT